MGMISLRFMTSLRYMTSLRFMMALRADDWNALWSSFISRAAQVIRVIEAIRES